MPTTPWTHEERAWAMESFRCGDTIAEIADTAERTFLDVAAALGMWGFVSRNDRWVRSVVGAPKPARWVGGMLREVAVYRCARGEHPRELAAIAQADRSCMYEACRGLFKRQRRLPPIAEAA